jgi:asparagine synthase (glutamine-hydrolysing)
MVEAGAKSLQGITIAYQEFSGRNEDEAPAAACLAAHYGIKHHVRVVTREEFKTDLPRILQAMDQPSVDGVNTWYASKAVAELGLKVVVSGVGGDELFQGYDNFKELPRLVSAWRPLSLVPGARALAKGVCSVLAWKTGNPRWKNVPDWSRSIAGAWWLRRSLFSPSALPALMGDEIAAEALGAFDPRAWVDDMSGSLPGDLCLALGQIESTTYLRNQLLRDSDWASMDHSVELRTPLVDAWLLRDLQQLLSRFRAFPNKSLLAGAPKNRLPTEVLIRRKSGFGIPMGSWLGQDATGASLGNDSRAWARRLVSADGASIQ